jgi:hypothetical protein
LLSLFRLWGVSEEVPECLPDGRDRPRAGARRSRIITETPARTGVYLSPLCHYSHRVILQLKGLSLAIQHNTALPKGPVPNKNLSTECDRPKSPNDQLRFCHNAGARRRQEEGLGRAHPRSPLAAPPTSACAGCAWSIPFWRTPQNRNMIRLQSGSCGSSGSPESRGAPQTPSLDACLHRRPESKRDTRGRVTKSWRSSRRWPILWSSRRRSARERGSRNWGLSRGLSGAEQAAGPACPTTPGGVSGDARQDLILNREPNHSGLRMAIIRLLCDDQSTPDTQLSRPLRQPTDNSFPTEHKTYTEVTTNHSR